MIKILSISKVRRVLIKYFQKRSPEISRLLAIKKINKVVGVGLFQNSKHTNTQTIIYYIIVILPLKLSQSLTTISKHNKR